MKPGVRRSVVLLLLAFSFMALSIHPLAILCYVLLTAHFRLSGDPKKVGFAVLLAAAQAGIVMNSFLLALAYAAGAGMGFVLALTFERRWSYGWQLTLAAGTGFAAAGVIMLAAWDTLRHEFTIFANNNISEFETLAKSDPNWSDIFHQSAETFRWLDTNYNFTTLGSVFGCVLFLAAITLCLLERWQRDPEDRKRRKPTGFQRMRVPDWVVWIAIATALVWFADYRLDSPALRAVAWNLATALNYLYLLNGLSVLFYALSVFKATAFGAFMAISGMILFGLWPLMGILGLFDTWYDFRMRFRRIAMLRNVTYRPDDHDVEPPA